MRLILTTLASAFMVFLVVLTARLWGQGQTFSEFNHEFFVGDSPLVIVKASQIQAIKQAIAIKKDVIIWLDVRISADRSVFVLPKSDDQKFLEMIKLLQQASPQATILKGGKLSDYTWEQINEFYKTTPLLKEVYEKFPQQRFFLNVIDNEADVNEAVVKTLKDINSDNRTFIQSDTLVVMTSIKDIKPEWVYGTSQADLMRFMTFESMWILPTTQFKGDVFVSPFTILKRPAFDDEVIAEMRRRHKKIILGPISSHEQFDDAKRLKADGYITENLAEFFSWLDQSQSQ